VICCVWVSADPIFAGFKISADFERLDHYE